MVKHSRDDFYRPKSFQLHRDSSRNLTVIVIVTATAGDGGSGPVHGPALDSFTDETVTVAET